MAVVVVLASAALLRAQPPCTAASSDPAPPFLNFRQTTLGYHGPDADLTGLTEYRIGWFGPTNLHDPLTGDLWWAADFAVREANEQTAQRPHSRLSTLNSQLPLLPFLLVPRWAENPWGTGVSQLTRMVYDEHPLALIGSIDSATTHLAEQVVAKADLPLISPIATDPSVTLAGVPWMFSCAPSDAAVARVLVEDILSTLNDRGHCLALLTVTDHESRMTTREVLREFSQRQRPPDFRFEVQPGAHNIVRQLAALTEARPDVILIVAGAEDAARLVRAVRGSLPGAPASVPASDLGHRSDARERGQVDPVMFGSQSMARTRFRELAGAFGDGVRFPVLSATNPADLARSRFVERFSAQRHGEPDDSALLTYDATRLLLEAIRQAGPSRARVRTALAALSPWQGIAGTISFDGTGQNTRSNVQMATLRSGCISR